MMDATSSPQIVEETECRSSVDLHGDDDLLTLKALTEKLRLETRRPSYLEWKAQLEAESFKDSQTGKLQVQEDRDGQPVTYKEAAANSDKSQRKQPSGVLKSFENIDEALSWLRKELVSWFIIVDHWTF